MTRLFFCCALISLTGCGAEVATTAATGAKIKQQELEQAKKTQEMAQKKIDDAAQKMQQSADQRGNEAGAK